MGQRLSSQCVALTVALSLVACAKPSPRSRTREMSFSGTCDASAAVALSDRSVLVAGDEDNVLRVYDVERGGAPTSELDLSTWLELPTKPAHGEVPSEAPEVDIEAAARIGDRAYFVSSHGRNGRGKAKPERLRFFATTARENEAPQLVGVPYAGLLRDLLDEPRLLPFGLDAASRLAPKAPGGLNIEGMTARPEGGVWLGFRNPIPQGRALLVPLLNPQELIAGARATFGDPLLLDLGGLGVRGLATWRGRYLIVAGPFDGKAGAKLFAWNGVERPAALDVPAIERYAPEAVFTPAARNEIMLLSDDGSRRVDGVDCKRLPQASMKRFRGLWLTPSPP
jgi:Protein of unknown function (DUF3616)